MKRYSKILSFFLIFSMIVSHLPAIALADDDTPDSEPTEISEQVPETTSEDEITSEYVYEEMTVVNGGENDNDELFAGYVDSVFYPSTNEAKRGGPSYTGVEEQLYTAIFNMAKSVADGEKSSTILTLSFSELNGLGGHFTKDDLQVSTLVEGGSVTPEAQQAMGAKISTVIDYVGGVIRSLLAYCPYEFYWYDKTVGTLPGAGYSIHANSTEIWFGDDSYLELKLAVASGYSLSENKGTYEANTTITGAASSAASNAQNIVNTYTGYSDIQKLEAYKERICALVEYNNAAAAGGMDYGDPWQLIWVFDGDTTTNVVCEGYSKAFKYLCDRSDFSSSDIECYSVSGNMVGAGPHMWNIVTLDNKRNYLADITNSDSGTIGRAGGLFLAPYSSGSVSEGYEFVCPSGSSITYTYDPYMETLYGEEVLTLSNSMYLPAVESITADPINLTAYTNGYWTYDSWTDEDTGETVYTDYYYQYNNVPSPSDIEFTITFVDDNHDPLVGTISEISDIVGDDYSFEVGSYNIGTNPLQPGTNSIPVTFNGFTGYITINVTPTNINLEVISGQDINIPEETHGYWDSDSQKYIYSFDDIVTYRLTLQDDTSYEGSWNEIYEQSDYVYNIGCYYHVDNADWSVGTTHQIIAAVDGAAASFDVTIVQNQERFVSISATPQLVEVDEKANGYLSEDSVWDEERDTWIPVQFYRYSVEELPVTYTVALANGTSFTGDYYQIQERFNKWISFETNQSSNNQWIPGGTYNVTAILEGAHCTFQVKINPSPIDTFSAAPLSVYQNTYGYWDDNGETGDDYQEYYYYDLGTILRDTKYTITYLDNTTHNNLSGLTESEIYEQTGSSIRYEVIEQDIDHPLSPGIYQIPISFQSKNAELALTILPIPIESITADPLTFIEGTYLEESTQGLPNAHGEILDSNVSPYHKYDIWQKLNDNFLVTYSNGGESQHMTREQIYDTFGEYLSIVTDQSATNVWTPSEDPYKASLYLFGVKVGEIDVFIVENPIQEIIVTPEIVVTEGIDSYLRDEEIEGGWKYYNLDSILRSPTYQFEIKYKGQSPSITGTIDDIWQSEGYMIEITDDQEENHWEPGTHTATIRFMGFSQPITVTVKEYPVESIEISHSQFEIVENSRGEWEGGYEGPDHGYVEPWFSYDLYNTIFYGDQPCVFTINLKDPEPETGNPSGTYEQLVAAGYQLYIIDDQDDDPHWGLGPHEVTIRYLNTDVTAAVTIVETPVASITTVPSPYHVQITENTYGDWRGDADPWYEYNLRDIILSGSQPCEFAIKYKDSEIPGPDLTGDYNEVFEETGYYITILDDQETNHWGLGVHNVTIEFMNVTATVEIEIIASPVAFVSVDQPIQIIENTYGYWNQQEDETGEPVGERWFCYDLSSYIDGNDEDYQFTIQYNDETSFTGTRSEILDQTGYPIDLALNQIGPWSVGLHTGEIIYRGVSTSISVEIVETPVESVSVTPATVSFDEHVSGDWQDYYYAGDDGQIIETPWYMYSLDQFFDAHNSDYTFTITYKNGDIETGTQSQINELADHYALEFTSNQGFYPDNERWEVNTLENPYYTANVSYMGVVSEDIHVTVNSLSVQSIAVNKPIQIVEHTNGYYIDGYEDPENGWVDDWYYYDFDNILNDEDLGYQLTISLIDGRTITGTPYEISQAGYEISIDTNQNESHWGVGNEYSITVTFMDTATTIPVEIQANAVASISVSVSRIQILEYTNGSPRYGYSDEEGELIESPWYYYEAGNALFSDDDVLFTITYSDGTASVTGTREQIASQTGKWIDWETKQGSDFKNERWSVGEHWFWIEYEGARCKIYVDIVSNHVASITPLFSGIQITEHTCGNRETGYYDNNGFWVTSQWYNYNLNQYFSEHNEDFEFTITYDNDTPAITGTWQYIYDQTGYYIEFQTRQGQGYNDERWELNNPDPYTATVYYLGVVYEIDVEIIDSPVASIVCNQPLEFYEHTNGREEEDYYFYDIPFGNKGFTSSDNVTFTIVFNDGRAPIENKTYSEIFNLTGERIEWSNPEAQYESPWVAGNAIPYQATISFMGTEGTIDIYILECPVIEISVQDVTVLEGTHGGWRSEEGERFYAYDYTPDSYHVIFTEESGLPARDMTEEELYAEFGNYPQVISVLPHDQFAATPWEPGEYHIYMSFNGVNFDYTYTIEESSIQGISIDSWETALESNGYILFDSSEDPFWYYRITPDTITVSYKENGEEKIFTGTEAEIYQQFGQAIYFEEEEPQRDTPWGLGAHTVNASLGNITTSYLITVVDIVDEFTITGEVTMTLDKDLSLYYYWNGQASIYPYYSDPNLVYSLKLTDGTEIEGNYNELAAILHDTYKAEIILVDDQTENPWNAGDHTGMVSVMGHTATIPVHIQNSANSIESISVTGTSLVDMIITVTYANGNEISGTREEIEKITGLFYNEKLLNDEGDCWNYQIRLGSHSTIYSIYPELSVSAVEVLRMPIKTTYHVGEAVDLAGASFKLTYSDGTTRIVEINTHTQSSCITETGQQDVPHMGPRREVKILISTSNSDFMYGIPVFKDTEDGNITINCGDATATIPVLVEEPEDVPSITVLQQPDKTLNLVNAQTNEQIRIFSVNPEIRDGSPDFGLDMGELFTSEGIFIYRIYSYRTGENAGNVDVKVLDSSEKSILYEGTLTGYQQIGFEPADAAELFNNLTRGLMSEYIYDLSLISWLDRNEDQISVLSIDQLAHLALFQTGAFDNCSSSNAGQWIDFDADLVTQAIYDVFDLEADLTQSEYYYTEDGYEWYNILFAGRYEEGDVCVTNIPTLVNTDAEGNQTFLVVGYANQPIYLKLDPNEVLLDYHIGDEDHIWGEAEIINDSTLTETGIQRKICMHCGAVQYGTILQKELEPVYFNQFSLSLQGAIGIYFYFTAPDNAATAVLYYEKEKEDGTHDELTFTLDKTQYYSYSNANGYWQYKLFFPNIPAKEMTEHVTLRVYDADGNPIPIIRRSTGELQEDNKFSACIKDWCDLVINNESQPEKLRNLAKAMLNYGYCAQLYFQEAKGYQFDEPANPNGYYQDLMSTTVIPSTYAPDWPADRKTSVMFKDFTLNLEGATAIRLNFNAPVTSSTHQLTVRDGRYYIEIPNIAAKELGDTHTIIVSYEGNTRTFIVSALTYGYLVQSTNMSEKLKDLFKAQYLYNQAARAYFNY